MSQQFLRVSTLVRALFRTVDGPDAPRLYSGVLPEDTAALHEELLASARRSDPLVRFLIALDRKVDTMLALLQREELAASFPFDGHAVELAGNGISLECRESLQPGQYLEILLLLEEYPPRVISAIARVEGEAGLSPRTDPARRVFLLAFTGISADDREHVIRFVFSEDRKRIRQEKDAPSGA